MTSSCRPTCTCVKMYKNNNNGHEHHAIHTYKPQVYGEYRSIVESDRRGEPDQLVRRQSKDMSGSQTKNLWEEDEVLALNVDCENALVPTSLNGISLV